MHLTSEVEWHNLDADPEDLPDADESVMATIETLDGERRTLGNVFYNDEAECWYIFAENEDGQAEKTMLWYKVAGWAYLPEPMPDYSWRCAG